jgi:hypothetical protein
MADRMPGGKVGLEMPDGILKSGVPLRAARQVPDPPISPAVRAGLSRLTPDLQRSMRQAIDRKSKERSW